MTASDMRSIILAFARHMTAGPGHSAETTAHVRNWLSAEGDVTSDGQDLVDALADQSHTRTVFRGNF